MIELKQINKSYVMGENRIHALKDVSLHVKNGEFLSIMGTSGSGKSTLMHIIGCMDMMDSGTYSIDGVPVHGCSDYEAAAIRNSKIGFIFQKYHLIPQYSVTQNVLMPLLIRGLSRKEALPLVEEALDRVGLSERKGHHPHELSGGQQQRAAIARAIVTKPALLLADEPTGALDSQTGREILSLFQELNQSGHTVIQITHDANVAQYAKKTITLVDGVIIE